MFLARGVVFEDLLTHMTLDLRVVVNIAIVSLVIDHRLGTSIAPIIAP